MIGTFYQPSAVFISISSLKNLPEREFFAGLSEVVKYAFIMDRSFLKYLLKNKRLIFSHEDSTLETIIYKCCKLKSRVVNLDEKEKGVRAILNFGHTLGHAIENCLDIEKFYMAKLLQLECFLPQNSHAFILLFPLMNLN